MFNPLICERCGRQLETDDAISVIEGICKLCRTTPGMRAAVPPASPTRPGETPARGEGRRPALPRIDLDDPALDEDEYIAAPPPPRVRPRTPVDKLFSAKPEPWLTAHDPVTPARPPSPPRRATGPVAGGAPAVGGGAPADGGGASQRAMHPTPAASSGPPRRGGTPPPVPASQPGRTSRPAMSGPVHRAEDEIDHDANSLESLMESAGMPGPYDFSPPMMYDTNDWTGGGHLESGATYRRARARQRALMAGSVLGLIVTFGASGYLLLEQTGRPTGRDAAEEPAIIVEPTELALRISPPAALVKVDGVSAGEPDAEGRIVIPRPERDPSTIWLEVTADGYQTLRQPLSLYAGSPEAQIELVRRPYELTVRTEPDHASIWVDGSPRGTGPLTLTMDPARPSTLVVRADGYREFTQTVTAPADGASAAIDVALEPAGVTLAVETEPAGAKIFVDGKLRGASPVNIELPSHYLGGQVELAASAQGYDIGFLRVRLPKSAGSTAIPARIALTQTTAKLMIDTQPPGGRIVIDGEDRGAAPQTIEFDASQVGREVVVDASLDGAYFGRRMVVVPQAGDPEPMVVPMAFSARKVVFLFAAPVEGDAFGAMDALAEQIRRLNVSQRFAIIAATDEGLEPWPGGISYEAATSEQKVRAFDLVRGLRPTASVPYEDLLNSALAFSPTTVWLVTGGEPDREALSRFAERLGPGDISLNVACAVTSREMEQFVSLLTGRHRGSLTLLGSQGALLAGTGGEAVSP